MADVLKSLAFAGLTTLVGTAMPAIAQSVEVPEGCEVVMSVQTRGCTVQHQMICQDLPEGDFRVAIYNARGPVMLGHYNRHYQTQLSFLVPLLETTRATETQPDPLDMDELISTGLDTYDFTEAVEDPTDGARLERMVGFDQINGETVEIDGRILHITEFEYRRLAEDGSLINHYAGQQFLDQELRTIYAGTFVDKSDAGRETPNLTPVDFITPGEPGFLSPVPVHDCPATDAGFRP